MIRFILACMMMICAAASAASAQQTRSVCTGLAKLDQDDCFRSTGGNDIANRRCSDRYLNALARCNRATTGPIRRIQPKPILPRTSPVLPRARRDDPPRVQPVRPRIYPVPLTKPVDPLTRR